VGAADEGANAAFQFHLDAAVIDFRNRAGDDLVLAESSAAGASLLDRVAVQLLDAQGDALLLDIDVQHLGLHHLTLGIVLDGFLARLGPGEVGQVHHAVHVRIQADEQPELGDGLDLALDHRAGRMVGGESGPGVFLGLLEAQADAALVGIHFQHRHVHFRAGSDQLGGCGVLLDPGHFADMDQAFHARLQLHEGAIVGDIGDLALELHAHRILGGDAFPGIGLQLLHAQADALGLVVDLDDLHGDGLAHRQDFGRVGDAAPGNVGDVEQAVHAAQVHKGAIVGDVLDHAFDDLLFLQRGHQRGALLGAALFQHGAARHDDVAAATVHLEDLEQLGLVHQRADIAHRAHVNLAAGQEGHGAVQVHGEAALDAAEDHAGDAGLVVEGLFQLDPAFLAASLVAAQHGFAQGVFDALQIDLDGVADLDVGGHARHGEFLQGDAAFGLQADVHHREVILDGDDGALDDRPFLGALGLKALLQHGGEIFAAGGGDGAFGGTFLGSGASHSNSCNRSCRSAGPHGQRTDFPVAWAGLSWMGKRYAL